MRAAGVKVQDGKYCTERVRLLLDAYKKKEKKVLQSPVLAQLPPATTDLLLADIAESQNCVDTMAAVHKKKRAEVTENGGATTTGRDAAFQEKQKPCVPWCL